MTHQKCALFFKTISLSIYDDDDDDRWCRACSGACSAGLRTDYSPPGRRIKPRWKSTPPLQLWCCLWWPWLVSAQTRRRSRKRFGKCKSSCTPRWRTSRGPRRKAPRRDRRAEDDKCTEREREKKERDREYVSRPHSGKFFNYHTTTWWFLFPLLTTKTRRFGRHTTNKNNFYNEHKKRKEEKT